MPNADPLSRSFEELWAGQITREHAEQVRRWRVDEECSWRGVAGEATARWAGEANTNQLLGMFLCEASAKLLGEDPDAEPWN